MQKRIVVLVLLAVFLTTLLVSPISAQERTVYWNRWDVVIDNVDVNANSFDVTETYDIDFTGSFRFGTATIPLNNLDSITNVSVSQNGRPLEAYCGGERAGTYCAQNTSDGLSLLYYFFQSIRDSSETFEVTYRVNGALRSYSGGDQLWWAAIPPDHSGFAIGSSAIKVVMPDGYAPREGVDPVETYGAPGSIDVRGNTITATATREISGDETFEIRVQYPHNPAGKAPDWQSAFDQRRATQPLLDLGLIALSILIALGGTLLIFVRWYTKGRDPKIGPVPTFLTEPPDNLSPAVVGTLIDEKADIPDVISILVDLAHKGYIVMEEEQQEGFLGIGKTSKFTFKRTDKSAADLQPYEKRMLNSMFAVKMERTMDSMRNTFYVVISGLQSDLYRALVNEGLFQTNPQTTRAMWSAIGVGLLVLAVVSFFPISGLYDNISGSLLLLPFAIGFVGLVALIAGQVMPAKTRKGSEEAAKWRAFYEYLRNLEKYSDVAEAAKHFDDYLPYAVAFGLDRTWVRRFAAIPNVPIPYWYYPTYMGGRYHGGYLAGTPLPHHPIGGGSLPGELAHAPGGGSLDTMSRNMSGGLENISSGLSTMLNSASRVMTSQPQSSGGGSGRWSSGGRSWSGGGGFGGGFSGGGGRGFG